MNFFDGEFLATPAGFMSPFAPPAAINTGPIPQLFPPQGFMNQNPVFPAPPMAPPPAFMGLAQGLFVPDFNAAVPLVQGEQQTWFPGQDFAPMMAMPNGHMAPIGVDNNQGGANNNMNFVDNNQGGVDNNMNFVNNAPNTNTMDNGFNQADFFAEGNYFFYGI